MREIDYETEQIISIQEAAKIVAAIDKKKPNPLMIRRWISRGIRGKRLPAILISKTPYTSKEALKWFLHAPFQSASEKPGTREKVVQQQCEVAGI